MELPISTKMMSTPSESSSNSIRVAVAVTEAATWYCSIVIVALILLSFTYSYDDGNVYHYNTSPEIIREAAAVVNDTKKPAAVMMRGSKLLERPCEEIYVVGEGETLHTIGEKCGDPFIVEHNPHIHDPDDVFPGLVIMINTGRRMLH